MDYQWYPGHMTKARRAMQEDMKLIDLVIELVDARIPLASKNPDIDSLAQGKARLLLLNKADLADQEKCRAWKHYFEEQGMYVALVNSVRKDTLKQLQPLIEKACAAKIERDRKRGILNRPVRALICGIPNVGKSTFINSFAGKAAAKTGNRPGVTKGKQWIRLNKKVELLDTPGILWPKFEDRSVGVKLAITGAIRDELLDAQELASELIWLLDEMYPDAVTRRYAGPEQGEDDDAAGAMAAGVKDGETSAEHGQAEADVQIVRIQPGSEQPGNEQLKREQPGREQHAVEVLTMIAQSRHCLKTNGEPDIDRAAALLIDDFRKAKLGKITLENPPLSNYD